MDNIYIYIYSIYIYTVYIYTHTHIICIHTNEKNEMGGAHSAYGGVETRFLGGKN